MHLILYDTKNKKVKTELRAATTWSLNGTIFSVEYFITWSTSASCKYALIFFCFVFVKSLSYVIRNINRE